MLACDSQPWKGGLKTAEKKKAAPSLDSHLEIATLPGSGQVKGPAPAKPAFK